MNILKKNKTNSASRVIPDLFSKALFFACLLFLLFESVGNINQPILEAHAFRQTQTALSAYWMLENGIGFDYITPVIGQSWSIPFEFPIYQMVVALVNKIFGFSLTAVGRVVSLLFFLSTLLIVYRGMTRLELSERSKYFSLALIVSAPIYLFWSSTFMIESAALFFAMACLFFSIEIIKKREPGQKVYIFIFVTSVLAILQKSTTFLPILGSILCVIVYQYGSNCLGKSINIKSILKISIIYVVPLVIGGLWVKYTDSAKMENPIGQFLTSTALKGWNFGTLEQRISWDFWSLMYDRVIKSSSLYFVGMLCALTVIIYAKDLKVKYIVSGGVALFMLPLLIFTNLHFVHDYYQFSNSIFLMVAVGVAVCYVLDRLAIRASAMYCIVLAIFAAGNLYFYTIDYGALRNSKITEQNNKTLELSKYIKENTKSEDVLIIYGYDWSSELAFYSQRKSLTVPWGRWDLEVIHNTEKFIKNESVTMIINCKNQNFKEINLAISSKYKYSKPAFLNDCLLYKL